VVKSKRLFTGDGLVLEVVNLTKKFGGITALDNVSMNVQEKELVALIGPNGSGKSTLFNCISGLLSPSSGQILFCGKNITHMPVHERTLGGLSRTFQLVELFDNMTSMENLIVTAEHHKHYGFLGSFLRTRKVKAIEKTCEEEAHRLLDFLGLSPLANRYAKDLSYGQRKLLQIGVGLVSHPRLLLLDEPTAAVNPTMIKQIKEYLLKLHKAGLTILFVEHEMSVVMDLAERVIVLSRGTKIADGTPGEIQKNESVLEAYLGV